MSTPESTSDNPASRKLPDPIEAAITVLVDVAQSTDGMMLEDERNVAAAVEQLRETICPSLLPAEMTPEIREVLGLPNFRCGPIADVFRAAGHSIEAKSEKEQAFVLFRFLHLALRHGSGWFAESCMDLDAALEAAKGRQAKTEPSGASS